MTTLKNTAIKCNIIPGLCHNLLIIMVKLANTGYYTIFMPGDWGMQVVDIDTGQVRIDTDTVF